MGYLRKMQVLFLMVFAGIMLLSIPAFAQDVRFYDSSVVTGFEPEDYEKTISTEYKYALIELEKEFPTQMTIYLGGEVHYQVNQDGSRIITSVNGYSSQNIDITWVCQENYDEKLDEFHFVPYLENYELAESVELPILTVKILGELPIPPMITIPEEDMPEIPVLKETVTEKATIPTSYNGKTVMPPIRDQGDYNICWTFSTLACIEGDLIRDGAATTSIDLSELHLAYFTLHNFYDEKGLNTGDTVTNNGGDYLQTAGNARVASNALKNMLGPVKESEVPYSSAASYSPSETKGRTGSYQVTGVYYYNLVKDRESVKKAIMDHGAVSIVYNMNTKDYYSYTYNSYYNPNDVDTNHVVAIVGWDDNFSSSKFIGGTPEGNGAWLVRNSWGVNADSPNGYFWMSYYDKSMWDTGIAFDAQVSRYDHVYAYDNTPGVGWWTVDETDTMEQSFYVDGGEEIKAIGFYSYGANLKINFTISSGSSSVTQTFTTTAPGYYLIPLSKTLTIQSKSKVTVTYSYVSGTDMDAVVEFDTYTMGSFTFTPVMGSDGFVLSGSTTNYDGKIKLFTNNASVNPLSPLTISQNNVLGYSGGIQLKTAYDKNATGYKITVYDIANEKTITPTIDKPVKSGSNVTIKIHGTGLVNGNLYKLTVYKYNTTSGKTTISNTVTVYGMPHSIISKLTAQPISNGVRLDSEFKTGVDGTRYYVYEADTNKQVKKENLTGPATHIKITGLENNKLYYAYARPYKIYSSQYVLGPKSKLVYFAPVAVPTGVKVEFSDATTAVISANENSTARGVRVLYRELGGSLKNGCVQAGTRCSITNLSQAKSYEFYVMHYNIINNVRHYGSGVSIQYTAPTVSTMARPGNAKIYAGNPTWTFTVTKSSDAAGISVLYRINEGNYQLCCEKAGTSCTKDLSKDQAYTFYIMQYKTVNGKKVYSPGITVKNLYGTKSLDGLDLATEFVETDEFVDPEEINNVLAEYNTEKDLLELGAQEFLAQEAQDESIENMVDFEDEFDFEEEEDLYEEIPAEFLTTAEEIDDYEPTEEDFIDVPMDGASADSMAQKALGESSEEESEMIFYGVGDGIETDPYAPSFRNK